MAITRESVNKKREELRVSSSVESGGGITRESVRAYQKKMREQKEAQEAGQIAEKLSSRVKKWLSDSGSYIDSYNKRFGGRDNSKYVSDSDSWLESANTTKASLDTEKAGILEILDKYGKYYNSEWVGGVREALSGSDKIHGDIIAAATQDADFWAQFNPSAEQKAAGYDTAEKVYNAWQTDNQYRAKHEGKTYNELMGILGTMEDGEEKEWLTSYAPTTMTIEDYNKEISVLEADLERYNNAVKNLGAGSQVKEMIISEINKKYGSKSQLEGLISQKKAEATLKGREDQALKLTDVSNPLSASYDPEFDSFATYDPAIASGEYAYLNMSQKERENYIANKMLQKPYYGDNSHIYTNNAMLARYEMLDQLKEDEIATYNYYFKKYGAEKAAEYLDLLIDTMNSRVGEDIFAGIEGNTLAELAYAGVAGLDQFAGGVKGLVKSAIGDGSYTPTSAIQYAGSMAREDLSDVDLKWYNAKEGEWKDLKILGNSLGQGLYDFGTTTANMVPSILTSTAIGLINPTAGAVTGAALLGGSAAGNAYQEKINLGYSEDEARAYGYMVGASEAVLEYVLGGVTKLGGGVVKNIANGALDKVDNVLARVAKSTGGKLLMSAGSEAFEEGLQSIIEPYLWQAVSGEEAQVDWEETLYSSLMGFMSGGMFEGFEQIGGNKNADAAEAVKTENTAHMDGVKYSIKRTQNMPWDEQINGALTHNGKIVHSDTLVLDRTPMSLTQDGVEDLNLAIPLSVLTKAKNGKDASHSIKDANLKDLQRGVRTAPIVINNPARNAIVFVTDIKQDGAPILLAFQKNAEFDGDTVHKATSIHLQMDVASMLKALPSEATVYAKNENELDTAAGITDSLRSISASVKFTGNTVTENVAGVNGENVDPLMALAAQKVDMERSAAEELSSAEGRAILGDDAVDIADIADAGNGRVTVRLTDGRTTDASALSFPEAGEAELWRVIGQYAEDAESARALLEEYRNGSLDAYTYARGVEEAFLYGKVNLSEKEMSLRGGFTELLSPSQRREAYIQGRIAGKKKAQQRQNKGADNKGKNTVTATPKKGMLHFNGDRDSLTARQKVSLQACEVVAKALGAQVYVFESSKVGSMRVGENGWYDPKDGSIHIDLYAGQNGEGVMVFTLAHELVHFIRDWSPAKFRTLSGFLAEQYAKKGQSVADLVRDQQRRAEDDGRKLSFEEAHEEWVADSMETMLTDGTILEKLAMLQAKDKSLVEKIRTFLNDFGKRLKAAYKSMNPSTKEGRIVAEMVDAASELQNLFADALLDAGENFQKAEKNTTEEGGVRFSMRYSDAIDKLEDGTLDRSENTHLKLFDETPRVYIDQAGARNLKIIMGWDIAYLAMRKSGEIHGNYHGLGAEIMKKIPEAIENPLYIIKQKNGRIAAITEIIIKGKKPVFVSIELDAYKATKQDGVFEDDKYNLVVTVMDAHPRYLKNNIFLGEVVYNKNNEAPAHFILRLKTLNKAVPDDDLAEASKSSISNSEGIVKENDSPGKRSSSRSGDVSDRAMLVDLFEQMVTDSNEYKALQNYKKNMDRMLATEEHLERVTEEIKRISFTEGPRDMEQLNALKQQQKKAVQELNRYDNILLGLEKSGVLRAMIERNRKVITQQSLDKAREYYRQKNENREAEIRKYYRESRRQAVERHDKAQVRKAIRKDVQRLDSLLNKGTKEKNVKLELQDFAGAALRTAKGAFLKNYNEYDMIRNGVNATMSREQKAVFARCQELLKELDQIREQRDIEPGPNSLHEKWDPEENLRRDDHEEALKKELAKNMAALRDAGIFRVENELLEDSIADQLMDELMAAYSALQDSENAHVRGVFSSAVYDQMDSVKKFLAGKAIKDMTAIELGELQKMYRMVVHTITTSNDLFAQQRKADVRKLGEEVIGQLRTPGKEMTPEILDTLAKMGWANLKPETALEVIGSDTLTEMMQGLYRGEDTYARDLEHARQYAEEQGKKYGRSKWDMKKTLTFAGTKITLGQAMSLYAYTKRKQAQGHLEGEGFTHSSNVRIKESKGKVPVALSYIMNATKTNIVPKNMYEQVAELLTPEQRKYADAMQEYLSKVMGAKGNEVSLQLYGIKLFEETMYFPLKTASEYREEALGTTTGEVKLKNSGFTHKLQDKASNPIVLDSFEDVWAAHVDKMSLYHGFVLPMEDFDRVYNYRHAQEENLTDAWGEVYMTKLVDTNESVKVDIENKLGKAANEYIENLMKQLNGGVRGDSTEKLFGKMVRTFKKTAVLGSLSVVVQQPAAFIRAMAYLDIRDIGNPKDFLGKAGKPEGKILEEMYKYAPVALMKKIGGFDPGLGRTTQQYVFEDKQGVRGALDKFLGMFPEKMDEWTWSYIWICTKRQIHRQYPDLQINSQEFLEKVGERFSKIIRDTQVYDSVLTKSQIMRSKNVFLQMATAFMNEPTTSMDMYIRSTIQAKRGKIKKNQAARTYAAVVGSQILTSAVSALVYALRDDDEDETYWEKYLSAAINKAWENVMPWYSIPFVKDIFSVFEGYSVERSDISLYEDLAQGWKKLHSSTATPWEKVEAFAGSILNVFGIPLKNVSRDVRGIYNTVNTWINSGVEKTGAGLRYAALEGLTGKETSKEIQLQNAVAENDAKHILRVLATYSDEKSAFSNFRSAVKEVYLQEKITQAQAVEFLQTYAGDDKATARDKVSVWNFQGQHPELDLTNGKIMDYLEFAEPAGIRVEVYADYCEKKEGYTKRDDILRVIHKLPISKKQKDALYFAEGYAESTLDEAPWH